MYPIERQLMRPPVDFHHNCPAQHRFQRTREPPPPFDRQLQLDEYPLTDEPLEVRPLAQDSIQAGRGHLERVMPLDRILRIEDLTHRMTYRRAIVDRDPALAR